MSTHVPNASASCFFYGIKAFIYASKLSNGGEMGVYIDDELQDTVDLQSPNSAPSVVYSSHDLPFGKHKIEVRHSDSSDKSINLICFLYRPHLIFDSCVYRPTWPSEWKPIIASGTQPAYHQSTNGAATHLIRCTRFWLVGLKGENYGSFNIRISNGIETKVNTNVSTHYNLSTIYSVLLYKSPVLEFNTYIITIMPLGDNPVAISDIFFSQQPKDAVIVYGKDLKASGTTQFDPTRETLGLKAKDSTFQFTYFGTKFFIFGESDAGGSAYTISDDKGQDFDSTSYNSEKIRLHRFGQIELQFGTHVITLTQTESQPKYLFISYIFYLTFSDPPVEPYEFLTTDSIDSTYDADNTTYDADNTTYEYIELPRIGSNATFIYGGYNFTLEGYVGPANGNVNIYDNGTLLHSNVPLYREEYGLSFFYASENLEAGIHQISVVNCNGNLVGVSKIYYKPTPSQAFTQSISFSNSALFSKSLQFSDSEYFTKSISFSNSESFEPSTAFTYSDYFTKSSLFSESEGFSKSIELISLNFTSSFLFTYSNSFTSSFSFTYSNSFSASSDFPLESDNNNKPSKFVNIIIGVVVSLVVVLLIVLIIIFVYLRRRKKHSSLDNDTNTMYEADASTMNIAEITQNEDIDSVVNSFSNDIFGERNLNYEEDQNDYPNKNF